MVSVESKFRTSRISSAFCSEFERAVATDAELVLALRRWILEILISVIMIITCVQVKCIQPPLVSVYRKLQAGQLIPCSAKWAWAGLMRIIISSPLSLSSSSWLSSRLTSTPSAWVSGLFSSFHRAKSAHEIPSCWATRYWYQPSILIISYLRLPRHKALGARHCPTVRADLDKW